MPDPNQFAALYPRAAQSQHASGHTKMSCKVRTDGTLTACAIVEETPPNMGFGEATLKAAPYFKMRPKTIDGRPVDGGTVFVPLRWQFPG